MKVLILAGGFGTRLGEETAIRPKPMVTVGDQPILWHIMKIYSYYGFNDFVILAGYKQEVIKDYFFNYILHNSDVNFDLANNNYRFFNSKVEPWNVSVIFTGDDSLTGTRIKKAQQYVGNEPFMLTYGDGVSDVNISKLVEYHKSTKSLCTLTAYQPKGRFGAISIDKNGKVNSFEEKPVGSSSWINSGFFVCEPEVFDYIPNDINTVFEQEPLMELAKAGKLGAFKHEGFWHPMDMLKDKVELNDLWRLNKAPWKVWKS